jgi:hypothetical protein
MSIDKATIDKHEYLGYLKGTVEGIKLSIHADIITLNEIQAETQASYDALRAELYPPEATPNA